MITDGILDVFHRGAMAVVQSLPTIAMGPPPNIQPLLDMISGARAILPLADMGAIVVLSIVISQAQLLMAIAGWVLRKVMLG